ncbi:anti-anti-sigma factor [Amycolatopsis pretoriensis]|uniref:Anti-sigma factor antagonist n=1 Tax=Amycolatopsis pretoriensis TaxID=218821 RepID=A0A1H5RG91_9PSEU|nr:STAS domain-containing protein [Amycolatopsis pretoriensis]SEF37396.1 anti-anti-sigma factor [Amycolatopsis pretoriensis]
MTGRVPPQDLLRVTTHQSDDALVLQVDGELDLLSAPVLDAAVAAALESELKLLVIDLTGVTFLASIGMTILLRAHRGAGLTAGIRVVAAEGGTVARALELTGLSEALNVVPTRADALAR